MTKEPGVYYILNTVTGRYYVGSSICIRARLVTHFSQLRRGVHHCSHLQNSWNLHGAGVFIPGVAEIVIDVSMLKVVEQEWIDHFGTYNTAKNAERSALGRVVGENEKALKRARMTGFRHTDESKLRISISNMRTRKSFTPEQREALRQRALTLALDIKRRERVSELQKGKKRPLEVGARISAALVGRTRSPESRTKQAISVSGEGNHRFGIKMSESTKLRISETKRARAAERKAQKETSA